MSISLVIFCFAYYLFAGIALSVGYHRVLVHHSAKLTKWFERLIITIGLPAGTPIQWVGNHRYHHAHTDVQGDPHSPHVDGFWYAHNGWYINSKNPLICFLYSIAGPIRTIIDSWNRPRTNQQYVYLAKDIEADAYYKFISKPLPYMVIVLLNLSFTFGTAYFLWSYTGVCALWITSIIVYNLGDSVDSIGHLYGKKMIDGNNNSRNNLLLGILVFGDGWHSNHHKYPASAKHGMYKGQMDIGWYLIKLFALLGIATEIKIQKKLIIK
jgi:fatty-acid desaturase